MAEMIKTGMNNKQMKKIAMKSMGMPSKPFAVPGIKYKMTAAQDAAYDRKNGIKEGSAADQRMDRKNGVAMKKKSTPMIKPSRRGLLHEKLGVPKGQKIPTSKITQALGSKSPALRKEANFARNFSK